MYTRTNVLSRRLHGLLVLVMLAGNLLLPAAGVSAAPAAPQQALLARAPQSSPARGQRITDNDGNQAGSARSVSLSDNGVAPPVTFSAPSGLDFGGLFGPVKVGASVTATVTLTNTSTDSIRFTSNPTISIVESSGPTASSPGAVAARNAGARLANAADLAGGSGAGGASQPGAVRGAASSASNNASVSDGGNFAETDTCPYYYSGYATLAPGASCAITVTFSPQGPGPHDATLTARDSAPFGPHSIPLTGTATLDPADRLAFGWGDNSYGRLASGVSGSANRPVVTQGISNAVSLADGANHALAVTSDGGVYAWGYNGNGQLGNGSSDSNTHNTPTPVTGPDGGPLTGAARVAAGDNFSLALMRDGTVYAWGDNSYGQLGNGGTTSSSTPVLVADPTTPSNPLSGVKAIAAGSNFALALMRDGTVYGWGDNGYGQLGNGSTAYRVPTPTLVADPNAPANGLSAIAAVAVGANHSLFLSKAGTVYAAGYNGYGQLGFGTTDYGSSAPSSVPMTVTSLGPVTVTDVAAGANFSLALGGDGTVYAWGYNGYGQLGTGNTEDSPAALQVPGLTGVAALAAGAHHSLASRRDGSVYAWGYNGSGQLGTGSYASATTPSPVAGLSSIVAVAAGGSASAALTGPLTPPTRTGAAQPSADALAFGEQTVGVASPVRTIAVSNTGDSALTVTGVAVHGADYALASTTCADGSLAAHTACTIGVVFTPVADGPRPGALTFGDSAGGAARMVSLGGVGVRPRASFNRSSIDFGTQQINHRSDASYVQVANNGLGQLRFGALDIISATAGDNAPSDFAVVTDTTANGPACTTATSLDPGGYCDVYVAFTPSITATRQATLRVTSNDPSMSPYSVTLSGSGIDTGVGVSPAGLDFGKETVYATSSPLTLTIANTGTTALLFPYSNSFQISSSEFRETARTCPASYGSLDPGASCTVSLAFTPRYLGARYDSLYIYDNAPGSPRTIPLTGTGAGPIAVLSGATLTGSVPSYSLDLGATSTSKSARQSFTLSNTGDATLNLTGTIAITGANSADFAESDACGASVAIGASCPITVTFTPRSNGLRGATLLIPDNGGDSPQTIALSGHGLFAAAARPVYAWGFDYYGQLGDGNSCYYCTTPAPVQTTGISAAVAVAAGDNHSLAVTAGGSAYAWGYNGNGQLGDGTNTNRTTPVPVQSPFDPGLAITNVVAVAGGVSHSLALTREGTVYAWGDNGQGQLGTGDNSNHYAPVAVASPFSPTLPITGVQAVAAAGNYSLALMRDGTVYAWGDNGQGQLGVNQLGGTSTLPAQVVSPISSALPLANVAAIAAGGDHSLFLDNAGAVYAAGADSAGQLGDGANTGSMVPVTVTNLGGTTVTAIAAGASHSLALTADGTVYAWGYNGYGQLGAGNTNNSNTPRLAGLTDVTAIAAGAQHSLAILGDHTVQAWGYNGYGQLGTGSYSFTTSPTAVSGLSGAVAVAGGGNHSLAVVGPVVPPGGATGVAPRALSFGQQKVGTTGPARTVTVSNTSAGPISVTGIALITDTVDFTITNDGCSGQLLADHGSSCAVSVAFAPRSRYARTGGLGIATSGDPKPRIVALGGVGTVPVASASADNLAFGDRQVDTTSDAQYVYLYNNGDAPLTVSSVAVSGTNSADFSARSDCATVPPGGDNSSSCHVAVTFTPSITGTETATLQIADDASNGATQAVTLTGAGIDPGIAFNPSGGLSFGNQEIAATSSPLTVTVTNTGTTALAIYSIYTSNEFGYTSSTGGANCYDSAAGAFRTLAPGGSCDAPVTFTPGDNGPRAGALYIRANDANGATQSLPLTGVGVTSADLAVSLAGAPNPVAAGASLTYTATVVDRGPKDATNVRLVDTLPVSATFVSASPSTCAPSGDGHAVTCAFGRLAADPGAANHAATATIVVSPTANGRVTDTVTVTATQHDPDSSNNTASVTTRVGGALVAIDPAGYDYGAVPQNTAAARVFTITNEDASPLAVSGITVGGPQSGDFQASDPHGCASPAPSIAGLGGTCAFTVTFTPGGLGVRAATIQVTDNSGGVPGTVQTVSVSGTGVAAADLAVGLSGAPDPAPVGGPLTYTIPITNNGPAVASNVALTDTLSAGASFVAGSSSSGCAASNGVVRCALPSLNPGGLAVVSIVVDPAAAGIYTNTVTAGSDVPDPNLSNNTATVLSTVGTRAVSVSAASLDVGRVPVGQSVTGTVTVTNSGTAPVQIYGVTVDGANGAEFALPGGCAGSALAPGASCAIPVVFTPGDLGDRAARLTIDDNTVDRARAVDLHGVGTAPRLALAGLDFGGQGVGVTVTRTLTLANTGNSDLQLTGIGLDGGSGADFALGDPNGCSGLALAPGATCDVSIAFTPHRVGHRSTTLTVTDNAADSPQSVEFDGSGRGTIVQGVTTDRNSATAPTYYLVGNSVLVSATVLDADNNPAEDAAVTATVSMTSANNPVLATVPLTNGGSGDVYTGTITGSVTTAQGVYILSIVASRPGAAPTPYPTYNTFTVSTPALALSPKAGFPASLHQGDTGIVNGGVLNLGYNVDGATVALSEVDGGGNTLTTLVTGTVGGIAARSGKAFALSFDTTALAEGTHHLRLTLSGLPATQDPAAITTTAADVSIAGAQPSMALAPSPLNLSVGVAGTTSVPVTVTNGASVGTLHGALLSLATLGRPGAQDIPWLSLSSSSLGDVGPKGMSVFTVTASPAAGVAPGVYQTYLVASAQGVPTQYVPVTVIVDSGRHGSLRFIVTAPNGVAIPGATVKVTEQAAPYTTLAGTTDAHGLTTVPGVSTDIPYTYTVDAPGFASAQDNVTLNSEDGKTLPVTLQVGAARASWSVTPITITDSYNVDLHIKYETDLPVPKLIVVPQVLQFDQNHPDRSGTMTVYNTSRVEVDNVAVRANNTGAVQFTLTYTDTVTGKVISGSSITLPGIRGLSHAEIHYEATSSCAPGAGAAAGDPNNPDDLGAPPAYASSYITAQGTYQYYPNVATPSLDVAHGRGLQGSTLQDMVIGRSLSNTGYSVMGGITFTNYAAGGLRVDAPGGLSDLAPDDPAESAPFTVHTTGLVQGVYTSTVVLKAANTPDSTLAFTATVDDAGRVLLDYDFAAGDPPVKTGTVGATPVEVRDVYCDVAPPSPPPDPVVTQDSHGLNISFSDGGGGSGDGGDIPDLPEIQIPPRPTLTAHEVIKLDIPQRISLERQAFSADLQLTDVTRQPLQGVNVTLHVVDSTGKERAGDFAITTPGTNGYSPGDNLGTIDSGATADNQWTLVPAPGLGGQLAAGQVYSVTASYQYSYNGNPAVQTTQPVTIAVYPMPQLQISYAIPRDIKAFKPFKLGVIVRNIGYGPAHNMRIQSGQPKIVGNASHAFLHFTLLGARLAGSSVPVRPGSLNLPIGEIGPGETKAGYWAMVTDTNGQFTGFDATYQEQPFQGLRLSPLILGVRTYIVTHSGAVPGGGTELQVASVNTDNPTGQSADANTLVDLESGDTDILHALTPTVAQTATLANKTAIVSAPPITDSGYLLAVITDTLPPAGLQQGTITRITVDDDDSRFLGTPRILPAASYWQQEDMLSPGDIGGGAEAAAQAARTDAAGARGVGPRDDPAPPVFVDRVYILDAPTGAATYTIYYGATPRQTPAIRLSPDSGPFGTHVQVTSTSAFTPSDTAAITMGSTLLDSNVIVGDDGTLSDMVSVPGGPLGPRTVQVCDAAGDICASAPFTVTAITYPTRTPRPSATARPGTATPTGRPTATATATGLPAAPSTPAATGLPTASGPSVPTPTATTTAMATPSPTPTTTAPSPPLSTGTATPTQGVPTAPARTGTARTGAAAPSATGTTGPATGGVAGTDATGTPYPTASPYPTGAARHLSRVVVLPSPTPITLLRTVLRATLALDRASAHIGDRLCASGTHYLTGESVSIAVNSVAVATATVSADGTFTACFAAPGGIAPANGVTAIGAQSHILTSAAFRGLLDRASTYYFVGGSTVGGDETELALVNTGARAATVTLRLYAPAAPPRARTLRLGAHMSAMLRLGRIVPRTRGFGLRVQSSGVIAAQMIVRRGARNPYTLLGSGALARRWYLAEGYTGGTFHETVYLLNPNTAATRVQLHLLPFNRGRARTVSYTVGAQRSLAVDINRLYPSASLAVVATSGKPVGVARVLTFGARGYGATANVGTVEAATTWLFAEGSSTRRFETFFTILNPGARAARVTALFVDARGRVLGHKTLTVGALRRGNIRLNDTVRAAAVAATLTATRPVVVERPYYFGPPNGRATGASIVYGRSGTGLTWTFPAGDTMGGGHEQLLVLNPNGRWLRVRATFFLVNGRMVVGAFSVPPNARYTLDVRRVAGVGATLHGARLVSTNGLGFIAEQSIYNRGYTADYSTAGLAQ